VFLRRLLEVMGLGRIRLGIGLICCSELLSIVIIRDTYEGLYGKIMSFVTAFFSFKSCRAPAFGNILDQLGGRLFYCKYFCLATVSGYGRQP